LPTTDVPCLIAAEAVELAGNLVVLAVIDDIRPTHALNVVVTSLLLM